MLEMRLKNLDELDRKIKELEMAWSVHHKNPRKYPMPDMLELSRLRQQKEKQDAKL